MSLLNLELTNCLDQWASESHVTSTYAPVSASKSGIAGANTVFYGDARDSNIGSHAFVRITHGHEPISSALFTILLVCLHLFRFTEETFSTCDGMPVLKTLWTLNT